MSILLTLLKVVLFTITEDEIGVPITEELRDKVSEYLTEKFIPKNMANGNLMVMVVRFL